jgi:hypothetical protein
MKKLIFTGLAFFIILNAFSQNGNSATNSIGKSFISKTSISVTRYNPISGKNVDDSKFLLNDGTKFFIYGVTESGYIISIWNYKDVDGEKAKFYKSLENSEAKTKSDIDQESFGEDYKVFKAPLGIIPKKKSDPNSIGEYEKLAYLDSWANNLQFFIPLKDFNDKCEPIYPHQRSFTWGFLTLPIKARFGNKDASFTFEEKVNFGISFGLKWQHVGTTYSASNLLGGVSVGSVKIDNDNSASALSFSVGYMYQYDKFQIGLFSGVDYTGQSPKVNWAYQGKPWVGFAIGVSLFGENKTSAESTQSQ